MAILNNQMVRHVQNGSEGVINRWKTDRPTTCHAMFQCLSGQSEGFTSHNDPISENLTWNV